MKAGSVLLLLLVSSLALADEGKKIERNNVRLVIPPGWKERAEVAKASTEAMFKDGKGTGGAIAYSDPGEKVLILAMWLRSRDTVAAVRKEINDYHAAIKTSLEGQGLKMSRWELAEAARRITSQMDGSNGKIHISGMNVGAIDTTGHVLGFSIECMYQEGLALKAMALCQGVLDSAAVTAPDKDLRPLEK